MAEAVAHFRFDTAYGKDLAALPALRRRPCTTPAAAALPAAGGEAGAAGPAQGDLRHRHPGRGRERADPHRRLHRAHQVRRREGGRAARARVQADRRTCRPQGLRRPRLRRLSGPRARDREPQARRQGESWQEGAEEGEAAARLRALEPGHLRQAAREAPGDAELALSTRPRDAGQRVAAGGGRAGPAPTAIAPWSPWSSAPTRATNRRHGCAAARPSCSVPCARPASCRPSTTPRRVVAARVCHRACRSTSTSTARCRSTWSRRSGAWIPRRPATPSKC